MMPLSRLLDTGVRDVEGHAVICCLYSNGLGAGELWFGLQLTQKKKKKKKKKKNCLFCLIPDLGPPMLLDTFARNTCRCPGIPIRMFDHVMLMCGADVDVCVCVCDWCVEKMLMCAAASSRCGGTAPGRRTRTPARSATSSGSSTAGSARPQGGSRRTGQCWVYIAGMPLRLPLVFCFCFFSLLPTTKTD
jgi:hypothetical protein